MEGTEFSRQAYDNAVRRYANEEDVVTVKGYLEEKKISISANNREWFTEVEKNEAIEYWNSYQEELFGKIKLRWMYRGSNGSPRSEEMNL